MVILMILTLSRESTKWHVTRALRRVNVVEISCHRTRANCEIFTGNPPGDRDMLATDGTKQAFLNVEIVERSVADSFVRTDKS